MSELHAYLGGRFAGRLIRKENGNLQFRYDAGYDGAPISQSLPLRPEAHPHAVCRAVFGGLLLEGDARAALARNVGVSAGNDFALLEEVGGDCAGAVTLLAPGDAPAAGPTSRRLDAGDLDRLLRELPQRPLAADPGQGIRLSLAGAQPKLPVILQADGAFALPTNSAAATTHIIKPEPGRFPGLVDNESFCMDLAQAAHLSTASTRKGVTISGLAYLLVERYDRDLTADPIQRLHQEDFCQALGVPSDRKYQAEGGPGVRDCVELVRACTYAPALELPRLLEALAFTWLIGNCDAHAKNFSLLYDAGAPTIAPLYDLVSTMVHPELTTRLAMSIDGARRLDDVCLAAWERLAPETGLRRTFILETVRSVGDRVMAAAGAVAARPEHRNTTVDRIVERLRAVAAVAAGSA